MVTVNPIRTEEDHETALREIEFLMSAEADSLEGDRLDILVTLVEAYEAKRCPIEAPDPIALLEFVMEQRGLDRTDLRPYIGTSGRVSEVLNRVRPLSIDMIRQLSEHLHLSASVLIQRYPLKQNQSKTASAPRHAVSIT